MRIDKHKIKNTLLLFALCGGLSAAGLTACSRPEARTERTATAEEIANMDRPLTVFGTAPDGQEVNLYTLTNANGMTVKITNYGAIVTSIVTPDRDGNMGDVSLGFDSIEGYIPNDPHMGGVVGRYANRIAGGRFTLDGQEYTLQTNDSPNHLHGGITGFDRVVWVVEDTPEPNTLKLTYLSKSGEEGYPGNLLTTVIYTLTDDNALRIDYEATTDQATPVNLTNHSYFNLSAGQQDDILNHILTIHADEYTVTDDTLIPTGEVAPVEGTPYDFRKPRRVGERFEELQNLGYDLNYVIRNGGNSLTHAATLYEPNTGRVMEVHTTQPGLQLYTGYHLDGTLTGKNNQVYTRFAGLCLEAQHFPDSPNQENFPSTIVRPGETYRETTIYKFTVREEGQQ